MVTQSVLDYKQIAFANKVIPSYMNLVQMMAELLGVNNIDKSDGKSSIKSESERKDSILPEN